jgi:hypothetical protein
MSMRREDDNLAHCLAILRVTAPPPGRPDLHGVNGA